MNWTELNLMLALPEVVLAISLFTVLLVDLWVSDAKRVITHVLSLLGLIATLVAQWFVWTPAPEYAFHGFFVLDGIAQVAKMVIYVGTLALFVYAKPYLALRHLYRGEFYTLTLFSVLGMSVMVSAANFLSLYVGLELLSLSLYAMVALQNTSGKAVEAALKYFVLGSLASGILLYGISLIYGATGTLELQQILNSAAGSHAQLLKLGLIFVVVAIAFKLGAVPFHMWVPDVYQGAPTAIAALIGTVAKVAATVFAFRILVNAFETSMAEWSNMLISLAVLSLLLGNLVAIMQSNIKRMLAYSTVSHMGFILLAFASGTVGFHAALFYAITYVVMGLPAFGILMAFSSKEHEAQEIADLSGLNRTHPWYAFLMLLSMFSMAGIPPLMGFYAKFSVIQAMLSRGQVALSVFAVMMSLIGAFYYLRVVKVMYFDEPKQQAVCTACPAARFLLSVNALLLLVWGITPQSLIDWCIAAIKQTLS